MLVHKMNIPFENIKYQIVWRNQFEFFNINTTIVKGAACDVKETLSDINDTFNKIK